MGFAYFHTSSLPLKELFLVCSELDCFLKLGQEKSCTMFAFLPCLEPCLGFATVLFTTAQHNNYDGFLPFSGWPHPDSVSWWTGCIVVPPDWILEDFTDMHEVFSQHFLGGKESEIIKFDNLINSNWYSNLSVCTQREDKLRIRDWQW